MPQGMTGLDTEHVADGPLATPAGPQPGAPEGTEHVPDLPRFGRFQALAELGAGATGMVYRAHDAVLGRSVAIKTLHAANQPGVRERFVREARAIGAVHHPNILAIYDAGSEADTPYLVMELASGGALRERVKTGRLPVGVVRHVGIQIARALSAAHGANILHRDVKPANILCTADGVWKLADFGIARLPDSTLTITGQFLGSPSYAAPESLRAGEFSPASDVYGLGATLYEALAGTPPHGDHDMRSLLRRLEQDPPPLRDRVAVPAPVGDAIMAALARDPKRRPTAAQLATMLAGAGDEPPAVSPSPRARVGPARRALVLAGLVAAALLATYLASRAPSSPSSAASGAAITPPAAAPDQDAPEPAAGSMQPTVVDENGDPVDEETARRVLEQIQWDSEDRGGRGHPKHKGRGK